MVIVGIGELGAVFARGFLRCGHPVVPVHRGTDPAAIAAELPQPLLVLVAVGEAELQGVLIRMPTPWRDRLCLIQNELLPRDWLRHGLTDPTVMVVWFEKRKGMDVKVPQPSLVQGPLANPLCRALAAIDIACRIVPTAEAMVEELVRKNVYILTTNIAGLAVGGTVESLWREHRPLVEALAGEVADIQAWLSGIPLSRERLLADLIPSFQADPTHGLRGRTAPHRLARALEHAASAGLAVPTLRRIQRQLQAGAA